MCFSLAAATDYLLNIPVSPPSFAHLTPSTSLAPGFSLTSSSDDLARRRLKNEFKRVNETDHLTYFFSTSPEKNNIMTWNAVIFGIYGSLYESGVFKLVMIFCREYPYKPPKVKFLSRIFHPNVSSDGTVCPEILQRNWSPATTVTLIIKRLISLLDNPCLDDETNYNPRATDLFQTNKLNYTNFVNDCVNESLDDDDTINEGMFLI